MAESDSSLPKSELNETVFGSDSRPVDFEYAPQLEQIGRYRILDFLGKGGYGIVYLALDEELERQVAIKVPHPKFVSKPDAATAYLKEARTVANLDHPHIIPVYDVGKTDQFPCFIVSKLIQGTDLATRTRQTRISFQRAAELLLTLSTAVGHAHRQGLVHRDIKPGNILLDEDGKLWLADFGLAMREQDVGQGKQYVGTAFYMSPEQASGEGHRVDSRSDIFSMGVVFYELLSGIRPFEGDSREEIIRRILTEDPWPLQQIEASIPCELARICHKAMARRVNDRYDSADAFSEDLRVWLEKHSSTEDKVDTVRDPATPAKPDARSVARIVPKGLRAFDENDSDFYLDLVPGPRDRDGLPDRIGFWKHRIEQTDPHRTFPIGVIYGPSGSGKSSLVKAGLLPQLGDDVCAVYLEATASTTESRLLNLVRAQLTSPQPGFGLKETLAAIRRGWGIPPHKKLLIVIDQFEQWLHTHHDVDQESLSTALRQCDGGRVQCIVMVRDEFWLAVSRFAQALEISLDDRYNSGFVDLFDQQHSERVLAAFGAAYGKLPELATQISSEQSSFLKRTVAGLARDGRVSCIRLSLLADMMKGKPWTSEGLKHAGGALGVGESFLEETFCSTDAPAKHRDHEAAARAILKSLLPELGTDIKGQMKSREELLQVSGYASRTKDFDELIRILDHELRLISPIDNDGASPTSTDNSNRIAGTTYFQLTHDYLVRAIRQWLTRKQNESRRGRAEIRLTERSALWNASPETRQLPSFWEYLNIRFFTRPWQWSQPERRLLQSARKYHLVHKSAWLLLLAAVGIASWQFLASVRARQAEVEGELEQQAAINRTVALVQQLRAADTSAVPGISRELESWRPWADHVLAEGFQQAADGSKQKLHLAIALMPTDRSGIDYVAASLPELEGRQFDVALRTLIPHNEIAAPTVWQNLEGSRLDQESALKTAMALALLSPHDTRWNQLAGSVAKQLTQVDRPAEYVKRFGTIAARLPAPMRTIRDDASLPHTQRWRAATALCGVLSVEQQIDEELPDLMTEWILETNDAIEFQSLLAALRPHSYGVQPQMEALLDQSNKEVTQIQRVNAAAVLLQLGDSDKAWPLLRHSPDPTFRNQLIDRLTRFGVDDQLLVNQLDGKRDSSIRQAIVLILGGSKTARPPDETKRITKTLKRLYSEDPDAGVHAAIEWTLRKWRMEAVLDELDVELSKQYEEEFSGQRNWTVNQLGQTYVRVTPPTEFAMGDTSRGKPLRSVKIEYSFAIASKEVSVADFRMFRKNHIHDKKHAPDVSCPVNNVSWYDAVAFCNWLSDTEGLDRCYEPNDETEHASGVRIPDDILQRNGYRLPTEFELECLNRAGTVTQYSFGDDPNLLGDYAWYERNAENRTWPVGSKMPNAFGAFDTHGNLWEWSQNLQRVAARGRDHRAVDGDARLLCGGAFDNPHSRVESGDRLVHYPHEFKYSYGFRPARTIALNASQ